MFLNSISPLKYLVVAVNGQRTLSQHCGEKQVSEEGRKALSPRYVSCNRHNPGNLTLKTGRRAEKEGRQVDLTALRNILCHFKSIAKPGRREGKAHPQKRGAT